MSEMYGIIELLCKRKGVKPGKMCSDLGISRGTIGDLKAGRTKRLSAENMAKIARYFDVSVNLLLGDFSDGKPIEFTVSVDELQNFYSEPNQTQLDGNVDKKRPNPVPESGPFENIVKLAGRDGSYMEKRVSDEQLALFQSMLDQMKPVDDESI